MSNPSTLTSSLYLRTYRYSACRTASQPAPPTAHTPSPSGAGSLHNFSSKRVLCKDPFASEKHDLPPLQSRSPHIITDTERGRPPLRLPAQLGRVYHQVGPDQDLQRRSQDGVRLAPLCAPAAAVLGNCSLLILSVTFVVYYLFCTPNCSPLRNLTRLIILLISFWKTTLLLCP